MIRNKLPRQRNKNVELFKNSSQPMSVGYEFSVIDENSLLDIKSVGYGNSWLDENSVVAEKKKLL